jgi:WD40 repeat protein
LMGARPDLGIQVWDTRTGRLEWSLACEQIYVLFSPDSGWLLGGGATDYRVWKTGSWEPGPVISRDRRELYAGQAGFRPDGRVLALPRSLHHVQLLDFNACREIATLPAHPIGRASMTGSALARTAGCWRWRPSPTPSSCGTSARSASG